MDIKSVTPANIRKLLLVLLLGVFVSGCAVSTSDTVVTAPAIKTREITTATGETVNLPQTVAVLPFVNQTESDFAYVVVRRTMFNHFASKNYRMLHWKDVDSQLQLAGLETAEAANAKTPEELMKILGVDGLIYGNITHYDKEFAGIASRVSVGVEMLFLNSEGKRIWAVKDVERSYAGGVSTSPVGLLMNALVAAKHVYGDINLYRAADELGRELAKQMPEPPALEQKTKPSVMNVVHSGVGQYLKYGDKLEIGLEGDPGLKAAAYIDGIGVVDLKETEPGQYIGEVNLSKDVNVTDQVVVGRLQDKFGQMTSWISPYGLLNVDNTPPGSIQSVAAESRDMAVRLTWQNAGDQDVAGYRVAMAKTETGRPDQWFESANPEYVVDGLTNFETVYLSIVAFDRAGNESDAVKVPATAAPDPRFGEATDADSTLPQVITGVQKLTSAGNPYYLRASSRIAADAVLLVGPGVEIVVSPKAKLSVLGQLGIFGDSAAVKVSGGGQAFDNFLVLQTNQPVTVSGLEVTGAGIPVQILAGSPLLQNSVLAESQFNGVTVSGSARPVIRNCTISGAKTSGMIVEGQAQPTLEGNRFINNEPFHLQNGSTYQLNAKGNTFEPAASEMTVLGDVAY